MEDLASTFNYLRIYLSHLFGCDFREYGVCTCGFNTVLDSFEKALAETSQYHDQPDGIF